MNETHTSEEFTIDLKPGQDGPLPPVPAEIKPKFFPKPLNLTAEILPKPQSLDEQTADLRRYCRRPVTYEYHTPPGKTVGRWLGAMIKCKPGYVVRHAFSNS